MTDHFFNTCSTCRNLFALLGLAMLLSCTEKGQTEKENGMLEAVLVKQYAYSIKDTTDLLVGRLRYSFKANLIADRFAFYDETQKRILVTDSLGNVLTVIGGEGKGPKEFVKVMGYTFDEHNNMVVLDGGQYLVKIFDLEGNPIHAFEPEQENISLAGWAMEARNDRILFGAIEPRYLAQLPNAEGSKMIAAYGYSGELLDTFGQYDSLTNKSKNYVIFPKIALDEEGNHIYTIRSTGYTIQEWNLNTKDRTMVFHQKPVHFQEPRRKISPHWPREKIGKESTGSSFIVDVT
ncbi:MAG: 6-bladed beta-propeller [Bacteroidota bacterium]